MIHLFITLWLLVYSVLVVTVQEGPVLFYDAYGIHRATSAGFACAEGIPFLWVQPDVTLDVLVHELAHAYDCIDNGILDGSPISRPATHPAWASDYCWVLHSEYYACSVTRGGWR